MDTRDDDAMSERMDNDGMDTLVPTFAANGHVDEGTIHTWLDGAFEDDASATVEQHVASCAECGAAVAEARGFIAGASRMVRALDVVPADVVPAADVARTASRIIAAADAARVVGERAVSDGRGAARDVSPPPRARRTWSAQRSFSAAAALLLMAGGGGYVWRQMGDDVQIAGTATPIAERITDSAAAVAPPSAAAIAEPANPIVSATAAAPRRDASERGGGERDAELRSLATASSSRPVPMGAPNARANDFVMAEKSVAVEQMATQKTVPAQALRAKTPTPQAPPAPKRESPSALDSAISINRGVAGGAVGAAARSLADSRIVTSARGVDTSRTRVALAPSSQTMEAVVASSASTPRAAESAGAVQRRDEAPPSECWSVQGELSRNGLRLPVELLLPEIDGLKSYSVRWIGWPDATTQQVVRMRVDNDGRLSGESVAEEQRVRLVLQRTVGGWQGTATHTIDGARTNQRVQLKRVAEAMCNP